MGQQDGPTGAVRPAMPPAPAPYSRLRRSGSGWVVEASDYYVWQESRQEAAGWERELAGRAPLRPVARHSRRDAPLRRG